MCTYRIADNGQLDIVRLAADRKSSKVNLIPLELHLIGELSQPGENHTALLLGVEPNYLSS